ncbi:MAG: hypothetical protein KTR31_38595 [Myxococcales bacterium]|nr:hypothetical protein [Myxococcales bacterium]
MGWTALVSGWLSGCGVKQYLPAGPALSAKERAGLAEPGPSAVTYTSAPSVPFPVLPLQVWGVHYDLDLVLESTHPRYDMHEYARVQSARGPVWFAKDALAATKTQSIVADLDDLDSWVPELGVPRKMGPVQVTGDTDGAQLDLTLRYENLEGEPVVVTYAGKRPHRPLRRRNGNTMGHSADLVMAVLDIPKREFAKRASITIDGQPYAIRKLLGLVKLQVALEQTQGGLAVARFRQTATDEGFSTDLHGPWRLREEGATLVAEQDDGFRRLSYTFRVGDDRLELQGMAVHQYGIEAPILTMVLSPALPDVRRRFDGVHTSRFAVDVNDQRGQAVGHIATSWQGDQVQLRVTPEAPQWVADRPLQATIRSDGDQVDVDIRRVDRP